MGVELVVAAVSAAASIAGQIEKRKSDKKAAKEQKAQSAAERARARRRVIREKRIKQGQVENAASQTGTQGSSGEVGAVSGLNTSLASEVGFQESSQRRADKVSEIQQRSANRQSIFSTIKAGAKATKTDAGKAITHSIFKD